MGQNDASLLAIAATQASASPHTTVEASAAGLGSANAKRGPAPILLGEAAAGLRGMRILLSERRKFARGVTADLACELAMLSARRAPWCSPAQLTTFCCAAIAAL